MTKPAFTHRPWCVTPCPTVHGGAFLFVKHNSTASKQRSVSACKVYFTAAGASGVYPRYDKYFRLKVKLPWSIPFTTECSKA